MGKIAVTLLLTAGFLAALPVLRVWLEGRDRLYRRALYCIACAYVLANLYMTILFRQAQPEMTAEWALFWSYRASLTWDGGIRIENMALFVQIVLNMLLYVPPGYLIPFIRPEWEGKKRLARVLAVCGLFSLMTETVQLTGRIGLFEFDDILGNLLGAAAGCGAYALAERMRPQIEPVLTKYLRKRVL